MIATRTVVVHIFPMPEGSTFQDFVTQTMGEFGTVPKRGLIYIAVTSALSAIIDLAYWYVVEKFSILGYTLLAITVSAWFVAAYAATMIIIEKRSSLAGFFRFTSVTILISVPALSGLSILVYASRGGLHDGLTISAVMALFVIGLLFAALLPAWPIAQAISSRFVSPVQIVKATSGSRWSLIAVFFAASTVNKLVPDMSSATNVGEAIALALCGAAVAAATLVLAASIAVTSWKFAVRRDASLGHQ